MAVAIFDLDNTLIAGDSDHAWGQFLVEHGWVDEKVVAAANDRFLEQYQQGSLDIHAYLEFALGFLANKTKESLAPLHQQFMEECIKPMVLPAAEALLEQHRQQGDELLIITATNRFVTEPIAHHLGVNALIACEPEFIDGRYTGRATGVPSFQEGKVVRLNQWLEDTGHELTGSYFYSDSHNDLPLLSRVDHPVAVNPDDTLRQHALAAGWPVLDLRSS